MKKIIVTFTFIFALTSQLKAECEFDGEGAFLAVPLCYAFLGISTTFEISTERITDSSSQQSEFIEKNKEEITEEIAQGGGEKVKIFTSFFENQDKFDFSKSELRKEIVIIFQENINGAMIHSKVNQLLRR